LALKSDLTPGFTISFGNERIISAEKVRYLGVIVDERNNFWAFVQTVTGKSESMYSRLRATTSADWGVR